MAGENVSISNSDKLKILMGSGLLGSTIANVLTAKLSTYEPVLIMCHIAIGGILAGSAALI